MVDPVAFTRFGDLLKYLRRRAHLSQRELAIAVGYSERQISRLEHGERHPDSLTLLARFVPALGIEDERPLTARLLELARAGASLSPTVGHDDDGRSKQEPARQETIATSQSYVPISTTPLIGREQEVAEIRALLLRDDVRLVTLVGPAGVGKTRLSLQVAAEMEELSGLRKGKSKALAGLDQGDGAGQPLESSTAGQPFADGVYFVPLAGVNDPTSVGGAIAQALGVTDVRGGTLHEKLVAFFRHRRLLLVLDNFEQVVAAAPLISELLAACPELKILLTSRERLCLSAEWLYDVEGLDYPTEPTSGDIEHFGAVRLFAQRARQMQRRWKLSGAEAVAVARICQLVEGLPLALELAAAAVRVRSCCEIARQLEAGIDVLATDAHDVPIFHRSMYAALEHSWQLLNADEQIVFAQLSVFAGGFREAAALEVTAATSVAIGRLLSKSLLRQTILADGTRRYHLHETVRLYARDKLALSQVAAATRDQHLHYFGELAVAAEPHLVGPDQMKWAIRLEEELNNLRAALQWAVETEQVEAALRLATALSRFWYLHGYWSEGRAWLSQLLRMHNPAVPLAIRGCALLSAADLAANQCDFAEASALFGESQTVFSELGDKLQLGIALQGLANVAAQQRDYERARELFEASLPLVREGGDNRRIGHALHRLGDVLLMQGKIQGAAELFTEGIQHFRIIGDRGAIAASLTYAADAARLQGDLLRARALCEEGLALCREIGHKLGMSWALRLLGTIAQSEGDLGCATAAITESLQLRRELRDTQGIAWGLEGLAEVAALRGQVEQAARLWGQAEALREALGTPISLAEQPIYQQHVTAARALLDHDIFELAWEAGRRMNLDDAIALALQSSP